jgi:hypothetical protein
MNRIPGEIVDAYSYPAAACTSDPPIILRLARVFERHAMRYVVGIDSVARPPFPGALVYGGQRPVDLVDNKIRFIWQVGRLIYPRPILGRHGHWVFRVRIFQR